MTIIKNFISSKNNFGLILILILFSFGLLLIFGFSIYIEQFYQNRIMPRVMVGKINIGGLTAPAATEKLRQVTDQTLNQGLTFSFGEQKVTIHNTLQSLDDPDVSTELVEYDITKTVENALAITRSNYPLQKLFTIGKNIFFGSHLSASYKINLDETKRIVSRDMAHIIKPPQNTLLVINNNNTFSIAPDQDGNSIDWENAQTIINKQLATFNPVMIELRLIPTKADVAFGEATSLSKEITELIESKPMVELLWQDKNWKISWNEITTMIGFIPTDDKKVKLGLQPDLLEKYLDERIKQTINIPAQDAKFEIQNGKVVSFQGGYDGQVINVEETINSLNNNFFQKIYKTNIIVSPDKARVTTKDANELGITEIMGIGKSNFSGSPTNRRHNIKVGADTLNGLLIKPGEEFSLISALGNIDATAGYLQELVIKGNKTVPEYGGGLCQIGTTTFRATLASGLPILERRNHSYRVRYYEPAGTDATIYDPSPDFRFLNDTQHYVLIQTRIEGDELIFEFWGTKDGRSVTQTEPKIYNIVKAPPTTYIETTDLKPGKQKCTESAHAGADAEFTYSVTYVSGETKQETFKSHYKPWGAVCLVGVETLSASTTPAQTDNQPTSTNTEAILTN
jgi:vancomycin resistance protein YoaR